MIFAHLFLPAIFFAICRAQPYHENVQEPFVPNNESQSLDQYRSLVTHSVAKMRDSCRVYDYLLDVDKKWTEDDGKLEVSPYGGNAVIRSNKEFYIHTLLRILNENPNPALSEENPDSSDASPNVIFNLMMTRILLTDSILESQLLRLLQPKCCRDTGDWINCLEKRESRTVKKVKFHSWGGKRDGPKIVLRTPFRPWGGKRSDVKPLLSQLHDEWMDV